jgi:hypothetical protein
MMMGKANNNACRKRGTRRRVIQEGMEWNSADVLSSHITHTMGRIKKGEMMRKDRKGKKVHIELNIALGSQMRKNVGEGVGWGGR